MANTLNKIHYGAIIQTNSTKTSSTIGLTNGVFFYTTDGYVPTISDSWEVGYTNPLGATNPIDLSWNTDLMSADGLSTIGSKIDIVSGGDYAFLQNANVKLANQTELGNAVHKTIELTAGLSIIGSDMVLFAVIDAVWIPIWTGIVSGTTFNDTHYTFVGADNKNNITDTINNVVIGMINATSEYSPIGELKYQNLIAYRFSGNSFLSSKVQPLYHQVNNNGFVVPEPLFNGVSSRSYAFAENDMTDRQIVIQDPQNAVGNAVSVNDFIRYTSDGTIYVINSISKVDLGADSTTAFFVSEYDTASVNYTFLFGDDDSQYNEPMHEQLETISDDKCKFSIYSAATDTGISSDSIISGNITVVDSNGKEYAFTATASDGNVIITQPASVNIIKPDSVRFFKSNTDLFPDNDEGNWTSFSEKLFASQEVILSNDMNEDSSFLSITGDKYNYFYLSFDSDDVKEGDDLKIGAMLKGLIEGGMQWQNITPTSAYIYYEGVDFSGGAPAYATTTNFGTSDELAKTYNPHWVINSYTIASHRKYGSIPYKIAEEIVLPNMVRNTDTLVQDYALPLSYSFYGKSMAATNIPKYNIGSNTPYSTYGVNHVLSSDSGLMYQAGSFDGGTDIENDKVFILLKVTASNGGIEDQARVILTNDGISSTLTEVTDEMPINFNLNGFCLYSLMTANEAAVQLTYKATEPSGNNSYLDLLKSLTNNAGVYTDIGTARDTWIAGLQVTDQQQRYQLVTNLCKQGFVGGFTSRKGFDTYKLIGDTSTLAIDVDNDNTLRDSIKNFKSSNISKVYNEFELKGSFGTIAIKNVTETTFPAFGADYSEYVVGVDDYTEARTYWESARRAYLDTGTIHKAPSDRTTLDFASTESSISVYANEYLDLLLSWTAYPKFQVTFDMPLTVDTVKYELLDYVNFNDPIITPDSGEFAEGWITGLTIDPKKNKVGVELTMSPDYLVKAESDTVFIIEDSANVDTITEDSANIDTITETHTF